MISTRLKLPQTDNPSGLPGMLLLLLGLSSWLVSVGSSGGITLSTFSNSAFHGPAASREILPGLSFTREVKSGWSLEAVGTLTLPPAALFNFTCAFGNTSFAFLWVDDHLICQDNNVYKPPTSRLDLPLGKLSKAALPIVLRVYVGPSPPAQARPRRLGAQPRRDRR